MKHGPFIGVGVFVVKNNKFLIGLRKDKHGKGTWGLPGGKFAFEETVEECARRELYEETGLRVKKFKLFDVTDDFFIETKLHYITIFMRGRWTGGEPQIMEPEKCEKWKWVTWDKTPTPTFLPLRHLLQKGINPITVSK